MGVIVGRELEPAHNKPVTDVNCIANISKALAIVRGNLEVG